MSTWANAQIEINFCPVSKIPANKQFNFGAVIITNNTGVDLELANNNFTAEWPGITNLGSTGFPRNNNISGDTWEFGLVVNNHPWEVPVGATVNSADISKSFQGNYEGTFTPPASATFLQDGVTYDVTIKHCAQTDAYELYDHEFEFNENCFVRSPATGLCLGEAASEVQDNTGVRDIMIPEDRPSYAIGIMVAYRLFANLVGSDEMVSPHFWWATGLNETAMVCEGLNFTARRRDHCYVNASDHSCTANGIGDEGTFSQPPNCFQILSYGGFLAPNQPDLFSQTNQFGTASEATVVGSGNFETGLIGVTYYQYQSVQYWHHIRGFDMKQLAEDANDPYAIEKIFYHGFHDGHNAGATLIQQIFDDYDAAVAADDMTPFTSGTTWNNTLSGSNKVANFTALLDGNGNPYPQDKANKYTKYYGCYSEMLDWDDLLYYFDKMKILYPQLMDADVQSEIKEVFDGINGGADVSFTDFGPIIDEIVIKMGGHDPSDFLATQYGGSTTYDDPPIGMSLRTTDTICPGEEGVLQVWLAGTPNFSVEILYPDGTIHQFDGIEGSPFYVTVDQPGDYEVLSFSDANQAGRLDCNFGKVTVGSKNSAIINWDKTMLDQEKGCAAGDLIVNKLGDQPVTVSYTIDGAAQTDLSLNDNDDVLVVLTDAPGGEYIITDMSPNECGVPINDTLVICDDVTCTPPAYAILTPDTSVCEGESGGIRIELTGSAPFDIYYTSSVDGANNVMGVSSATHTLPLSVAQTITIDSVVSGCANTVSSSVVFSVDALPTVDLGEDQDFCGTVSTTLDAGNVGSSYAWSTGGDQQTLNVTTPGTYSVEVTTTDGCVGTDEIEIILNSNLTVDLGDDQSICNGATVVLDAGNAGSTFVWSNGGDQQTTEVSTADTYSVTVTDGNGCTGTDEIIVSLSANLTVDLGADTAICNGASLTLDAGHAGADYVWDDNSNGQTLIVNGPGAYSVDVSDPSGCSGSGSITVALNPDPVVDLGEDTAICTGETLQLNAQNSGAAFLWNDNSSAQTLDVTSTGDYSVTVTNTNGCAGTGAVSVTVVDCASEHILPDTLSICAGESISIEAINIDNSAWTGGDVFVEISPTEILATPTATATYYVENTPNGPGDVTTDSVVIQVFNLPVIDLGSDQVVCGDVNVSLDAGNTGAEHLWNTNESTQTIQVTAAGTYEVTVTQNKCSAQAQVEISVGAAVIVELGEDQLICAGRTVELTPVTDGTTFDWSTGAKSATLEVGEGEFWVVASDGVNCPNSDTVVVTEVAYPVVELGGNQTICEGGEYLLDAGNSSDSHLWNTGETTQMITALTEGRYVVSVTNQAGCETLDSMELSLQSLPVIELGEDQTICAGEFLVLDPGNTTYDFEWSTGETSNTIQVASSGIYSVVASDNIGCSSSDEMTLTVQGESVITIDAPSVVCGTESQVNIMVSPAGGVLSGNGVSGSVFDPTNSGVSVNVPSWITYEYQDDEGCLLTDSVSITVQDVPTGTVTPNEVILCGEEQGELSVNTSNTSAINWQRTGASTSLGVGNTLTVSSTGDYFAVLTKDDCIGYSDTAKVTAKNPTVVAAVSPSQTISEGEVITLSVQNPSASLRYEWRDLSNGTIQASSSWNFIPLSTATYEVTAFDEPCSASDQITVNVELELTIPTAFTPNGDGINDVWEVIGFNFNAVS